MNPIPITDDSAGAGLQGGVGSSPTSGKMELPELPVPLNKGCVHPGINPLSNKFLFAAMSDE